MFSKIIITLVLLLMPAFIWAHGSWDADKTVFDVGCFPHIISDGNNGAVVASWRPWYPTEVKLVINRIDSLGNTLWGTSGVMIKNTVNNMDSGHLFEREIGLLMDENNFYWLGWEEGLSTGDNDIFVQKIDQDGNLQFDINGVTICALASNSEKPQIATDNSGNLFISWQDDRSGNWDIYVQKVDSDGNTIFSEDGMPLCMDSTDQINPRIIGDNSGGAFVIWEDNRNGNVDVYGQHIDANGNTLWTNGGRSIVEGSETQALHKLIKDQTDGFIVTYKSDENNYIQRYNMMGTKLWNPPSGKNYGNSPNGQNKNDVFINSSGDVIVEGKKYNYPGYHGYIYKINENGNHIWGEDGKRGAGYDVDNIETISDKKDGAIICVYNKYINADISMYRIDSTGDLIWGDYAGIGGIDLDVSTHQVDITNDDEGNAIIAWMYAYKVYVQKIVRPQPELAEIEPSITAPNNVSVKIEGYDLEDDRGTVTYVKLTRTGEPDIIASNIAVINPGAIYNKYIECDFDLTSATLGSWYLVAYDSIGQTSVVNSLSLTVAEPTPTPTITPSTTFSPTYTFTPTLTMTPTVAIEETSTPTITPTLTITPTSSPTSTITVTATVTRTENVINTFGQQVIAYPNPSRDKVNFAFKDSNVDSIEINIYSLAGDRIARIEETNPGQAITWETVGIAPGIYLAQVVISNNGIEKKMETKKIAIIR